MDPNNHLLLVLLRNLREIGPFGAGNRHQHARMLYAWMHIVVREAMPVEVFPDHRGSSMQADCILVTRMTADVTFSVFVGASFLNVTISRPGEILFGCTVNNLHGDAMNIDQVPEALFCQSLTNAYRR